MNSQLWRTRETWDAYPYGVHSVDAYEADRYFNPEGIVLTTDQRETLEAEVQVWRKEFQDLKHEELLQGLRYINRSLERSDRIFEPASDELTAFAANYPDGAYKIVEPLIGGMKGQPGFDAMGKTSFIIFPGESPDVDTAKNNLWALSAGANDSIRQFFADLSNE